MKSIHAVKVKEHFMSFCTEYKSYMFYRQFSFLFPRNFYQNLDIYVFTFSKREREQKIMKILRSVSEYLPAPCKHREEREVKVFFKLNEMINI